jgi:hypothetical protein
MDLVVQHVRARCPGAEHNSRAELVYIGLALNCKAVNRHIVRRHVERSRAGVPGDH